MTIRTKAQALLRLQLSNPSLKAEAQGFLDGLDGISPDWKGDKDLQDHYDTGWLNGNKLRQNPPDKIQ